jgi:ABC transporter
MPRFDLVVSWVPDKTFRTEAVKSQFTLQDVKLQKQFQGLIPIEDGDWKIGLIVGRSGTGKTSIAKEVFKEQLITNFQYTHSSILDDFPKEKTVEEITTALCNVGFASPPDWLKSYDKLSQGEKMRVDIARALLLNQKLVVFDEFTSVVDRDVAKVASYAISKAVARSNKKFVAVSCHSDIINWLQPDWVFDTDTMTFIKKKDANQQLTLQSMNAQEAYGPSLETIII